MKINIAIDGYSSCGKSTLAKQLAEQLHYTYIDSGAMYRAITLYFIRENVWIEDRDQIINALKNIQIKFDKNDKNEDLILLNGEDVSKHIREMVVADKVSQVAAIKEVRHFAVAQQQALGAQKGIVMDGRDVGTVVYPSAELKIFVTADPEIRVKRRFLELQAANKDVKIEDIKHNLEMRDYIDTHREEGPLRQAEDAKVLDNSDMTREEQLQVVLQWVKEIIHKVPQS